MKLLNVLGKLSPEWLNPVASRAAGGSGGTGEESASRAPCFFCGPLWTEFSSIWPWRILWCMDFGPHDDSEAVESNPWQPNPNSQRGREREGGSCMGRLRLAGPRGLTGTWQTREGRGATGGNRLVRRRERRYRMRAPLSVLSAWATNSLSRDSSPRFAPRSFLL